MSYVYMYKYKDVIVMSETFAEADFDVAMNTYVERMKQFTPGERGAMSFRGVFSLDDAMRIFIKETRFVEG